MKIKRKLKEMGVKLIDFAKELDITRPTLDSYISLYENGESLPTEKYEIIFGSLFNDGVNSKGEFMHILKNVHNLLERDKVLGVMEFSVEKTDLLSNLIQLMKKDIGTDEYNPDIYAFINMLVRSYKNVTTYERVANYFLFLNGKKEIDEIAEEDKAFYGNMYDLMRKDTQNALVYNSELFLTFENRVKEIIEMQKEQEEDLSEKILKENFDELVRKAIQEKIKQGYDVKDIDPKELFDSIDLSKL
jgi:predicted transcriptional regulator